MENDQDPLQEAKFLLMRADSLLSLAVYRGEGPHVPLWKSEADWLLSQIRLWFKNRR